MLNRIAETDFQIRIHAVGLRFSEGWRLKTEGCALKELSIWDICALFDSDVCVVSDSKLSPLALVVNAQPGTENEAHTERRRL